MKLFATFFFMLMVISFSGAFGTLFENKMLLKVVKNLLRRYFSSFIVLHNIDINMLHKIRWIDDFHR